MVASNQARAFDPSQPAHLSAYDRQIERLAIQMRVRKGVGEMTTDNRTNEPTEAQVEAAARAIADKLFSRWTLTSRVRASKDRGSLLHVAARAALVAAASVAPQAESVPTSKYISPSLPGMIRNLWKSDPSENSVRTALKLAGDLIQELIDLRAAQAQPSSTVDEAALIREAKAEALEEFASQMATGFNPQTLNAERRAIKREARTRAAEYREGSET